MPDQDSKLTTYDKKITITLNSEMIRFLKEFSELLREQNGYALGMTTIVRSLILTLDEIDDKIDLHGIKSQEELTQRIIDAIKAYS